MTDLVGQSIGHYRIVEKLGEGGMATVYKVWDTESSTYLALKLLREDRIKGRFFLQHFHYEAQTMSRLQHPNIIRYYGLKQENGRVFLLMEYIEGTTLRQRIIDTSDAFSGNDLLAVLAPVCSALYYSHHLGVIHCDIKPGNIVIGESGRVVVSDFGIARMAFSAKTASLTGAGTPAYMAPEQVKRLDPTPQTDIYALGIVLFEMLTGGERPFTGRQADISGTTEEKLLWEQVNLKPPSPLVYNPRISPGLEAATLKCLEKDPLQRYRTTLMLLNDLQIALGKVATLSGKM